MKITRFLGVTFFAIAIILIKSISIYAADNEAFLQMHTDMVVHANKNISATETIKISANGQLFKSGLYRKYTTVYPDDAGGTERLKFEISSVKRDGHKEPYHIEETDDGIDLNIEHKDVFLEPGIYTYEIAFNKEDELIEDEKEWLLIWYPTGILELPSENTSMIVRLPDGIDIDTVTAIAINNIDIEKADIFPAEYIVDLNLLNFKATRPLKKGEQFIVVIKWPK